MEAEKLRIDDKKDDRLDGIATESRCDFTLEVSGELIPCCRQILKAKSEYFRRMFASSMTEEQQSRCTVFGYNVHTVKVCLGYLQNGVLELNKDTAVETLKLAHLWLLDEAVKICEQFLKTNLDLTSWIPTVRLATVYGLKELEQACYCYLLFRAKEYAEREQLDELIEYDIEGLLFTFGDEGSSHCYNALDVWNLCIKWAEIQAQATGSLPCSFIRGFLIKWFKLSHHVSVVWQNRRVISCQTCLKHAEKEALSALSVSNCLAIKRVAVNFKTPNAARDIDRFIVKNHAFVFTNSEDFLDLERNSLLNLVSIIQNECGIEEFDAMIRWLTHSEENSGAFPELFGDLEQPSKTLKCGFKESFKTHIPLRRFYTSWDDWWQSTFFATFPTTDWQAIKKLARKYSFTNMEYAADFMIRKLQMGQVTDDLFDFSVDLIMFLRTLYGDLALWKTITHWIQCDYVHRRRLFSVMFADLPFERFSRRFLVENMSNAGIVKDYPESLEILKKKCGGECSNYQNYATNNE